MDLWTTIVVLGMVMCSRRDVLGGSVEPESGVRMSFLKDGSGKLKVGKVLIVGKIGGGLGGVNCTLYIASEIEKMSNSKVTIMFHGADERMAVAKELAERVRDVEYIDDISKLGTGEIEEGKVYMRRGTREIGGSSSDMEEMEGVRKRYDLMVIFNTSSILDLIKSRENVICVPIYANVNMWPLGVKIFFKDYNELYGDGVEESSGYVKIWESAYEFEKRVREKGVQGEFRSEYMSRIIPSEPYYFTYFTCVERNPDSIVEFLRYVCEELYDFVQRAGMLKELAGGSGTMESDVKMITMMTNVDVKRWVEEEVEERLEEALELLKQVDMRMVSGRGRIIHARMRKRYEEMNGDEKKAETVKILRGKYCITQGESEWDLYLDIREIEVRVRLVYYSQLSPVEFEYALLRSERVAGCTGDMSLSQVLSSKRVLIYECLEHNKDFLKDLILRWNRATGQRSRDARKTFKIHQMIGYFEYYDGFWSDYKKFIEEVKEDSFQKWLYDEILLRVARRLEGILKVDWELGSEMGGIPFVGHAEDLESIDKQTDGGIARLIEKLHKGENSIGAYLLEERRLPQGMLVGVSLLEVREHIEEVIEELFEVGGYSVAVEPKIKIVCTLGKYLEAIDKYSMG